MVLEVLATAVTQGEKKKGRSKIHYLQWHDNYIQKTLKVSIPKLLELISEFRKVGGCNIDMQKYAAFLYTNSKLSKRESREQSCLKITSKIPRNKLNQGDERLVYWKLQDISERNWGRHNGKIFYAHRLEKSVLKCPYYQKQSTNTCNPCKNSNGTQLWNY